MTELDILIQKLKVIAKDNTKLTVKQERSIVKELNDFFFASHVDLGTINCLGRDFKYFSDFHKYWHKHHKKILNVSICDENCEKVADALHGVFLQTNGKAFTEVYDTCGLTSEEACRIRLLTANQDFNGSRSFFDLAQKYKKDPSSFDIQKINEDPDAFIKTISVTKLSQTDKRANFAKKITQFLIDHHSEPYNIIDRFDRDVFAFRTALIDYDGAGYGNKKADMFIRDMIVLGIWKKVRGFEKIDVASDVNTIKIALKSGILLCAIPLVSSFIDIFSYQYGLIDLMSAKAWRRVWEIWSEKYPDEHIASPCLLDYFVYNVLGRQFCRERLCYFVCENGHKFANDGARSKYCPICLQEKRIKVPTKLLSRNLPCINSDGEMIIKNTDFVTSKIIKPALTQCPLKAICDAYGKKNLMAPKSISILGQTGWDSAYSEKGNGGGGLMA